MLTRVFFSRLVSRAVVVRNNKVEFHPFSTSSSSSPKIEFVGSLASRLTDMKAQFKSLGKKLESPDLSVDELTATSKAYAKLEKSVNLIIQRDNILKTKEEVQALLSEELGKSNRDEEIISLIELELESSTSQLHEMEAKIIGILTPRDDADDRDVILEVRAGTGGDEASLFASELFKMYHKYSLLQGWKWEELSFTRSDIGGFKEAQANINGSEVFKRLKFESGVHRVQRIPVNSKVIQTSAASVIVLPEAEEVDVIIRPQDLRVDVFRAGGAGGQNVNKTESAVRMTHIPTNIIVSMQDERSQIQNRKLALRILRSRVYDFERKRLQASRDEQRHAAGGTGDRSDKIRTYNFPQDRVSDHRVSFNVNGIDRFMAGEGVDPLIAALVTQDEQQRLEAFLKTLL